MKRRKAIVTFVGCKSNYCEAEGIKNLLRMSQYDILPPHSRISPEFIIINTCCVTKGAERDSRKLMRRFKRTHPGAMIIVTGCYAQVEKESLIHRGLADVVVGNTHKHKIPSLLDNVVCGTTYCGQWRGREIYQEFPQKRSDSRSRLFYKIQDGCSGGCAYCIIPTARGRVRSLPIERLMSDITAMERIEELVLTGVNLVKYGEDLSPPMDLSRLIKRLDALPHLGRIRLSSLEPEGLDDKFLDVFLGSSKICPHLHISLQSGDNEILKRMNRRNVVERFKDRLLHLIRRKEDMCIGLDIIVGFPGETDRHFLNTLRLISDIPVAYLHVFPFSERPFTNARELSDRVPYGTIRARVRLLRELSRIKREEYYRRFLEKRLKVFVEARRDNASGLLTGLTPHYVRVCFDGSDALFNNIVDVKLTNIQDGRCGGVVI